MVWRCNTHSNYLHRGYIPTSCPYCYIDKLTAERDELKQLVGHWQHMAGACREIEEIQKAEGKANRYKAALERIGLISRATYANPWSAIDKMKEIAKEALNECQECNECFADCPECVEERKR